MWDLSSLPPEILHTIMLSLPLTILQLLCCTNSRFNRLQNSQYFWYQKFITDHDMPSGANTALNESISDWKYAYLNHGTIWAFGDNASGLLVKDGNSDHLSPVKLDLQFKQIALDRSHFLAIDHCNGLWAWNVNGFGQLGIEKQNFQTKPILLNNLKAKQIACCAYRSFIIDLDDNLWDCGTSIFGQLRVGTPGLNILSPRQIPIRGETKIKRVSCGYNHTLVIDIEDNVWSYGYNYSGQLGLNDNNNRGGFTRIHNLKAKTITCNGNYSGVIDFNDDIWMFGDNSCGQLGIGDTFMRSSPVKLPNFKVKQIACGHYHSVMIDLNDNILTFGNNVNGQLGDTLHQENKLIPVPLLTCKGDNFKGKQVAAGINHTGVIDLEDNIWMFGNNKYGQLGLGDTTDRTVPVQIQNIKARQIIIYDNTTIIIK